MIERLHITSYFSLETDLASEMRSWPEFVNGAEYDVYLMDSVTKEEVQLRFVEGEHSPYVEVSSNSCGNLFDRAVGRAVHALAAYSDNLMIDRMDR
jgi:hypothetical protein